MTGALAVYLLCMNVVGFILMGTDKRRARRGQWRVTERALFGVAALGGSLGSIAGMWIFRHKTKHWYFVLGMPGIFILQLAALWYIAGHFLLN